MADVSLCAYSFPSPVAIVKLMLDREEPGRLGPPRHWELQELFILTDGHLENVSQN